MASMQTELETHNNELARKDGQLAAENVKQVSAKETVAELQLQVFATFVTVVAEW